MTERFWDSLPKFPTRLLQLLVVFQRRDFFNKENSCHLLQGPDQATYGKRSQKREPVHFTTFLKNRQQWNHKRFIDLVLIWHCGGKEGACKSHGFWNWQISQLYGRLILLAWLQLMPRPWGLKCFKKNILVPFLRPLAPQIGASWTQSRRGRGWLRTYPRTHRTSEATWT